MPLDNYGLGPERSFSQITYTDFKTISDYRKRLECNTHENLNYLRLYILPETLAQRRQDGNCFLEKTELQMLAEWRPKHDYQHTKTPDVLATNSIHTIRTTTQSAFQIYGPQCHYKDAVKKLQEIEGVSFPIATLILASYDPFNIPYFTDGVYRWLRAEDSATGAWDRKIDYIMKQYRVFVERVAQLRARLKEQSGGKEITALDIERVGRQIHEGAVERRKKLLAEGHQEPDDVLLRPLNTGPKEKRRLGPPLREEEKKFKWTPKKKNNDGSSADGGADIGNNGTPGNSYDGTINNGINTTPVNLYAGSDGSANIGSGGTPVNLYADGSANPGVNGTPVNIYANPSTNGAQMGYQ